MRNLHFVNWKIGYTVVCVCVSVKETERACVCVRENWNQVCISCMCVRYISCFQGSRSSLEGSRPVGQVDKHILLLVHGVGRAGERASERESVTVFCNLHWKTYLHAITNRPVFKYAVLLSQNLDRKVLLWELVNLQNCWFFKSFTQYGFSSQSLS